MGLPILGSERDLPDLVDRFALLGVIIAIGDNFARAQMAAKVQELCPKLALVSAIHPRATIASDVEVGEGTVIMAGAVVNPFSTIGRGCIINTNASLDHDGIMKDFSSLGPGVATGGSCLLGEYSAVGIGSALLQGIQIGSNTIIGAGSVVTRSVESGVVAYGSPARVVRRRVPGERYL